MKKYYGFSIPILLMVVLAVELVVTAGYVYFAQTTKSKIEPQTSDKNNDSATENNQTLFGNEIYTSLFNQYKINEQFSGIPAPLNFANDAGNLLYKTRIMNAYNAYVSGEYNDVFAGHYIFTAWGCGTSCRMGVIIDLNNGEIYWIPGGESDAYPEWDYYFVKDSNLLIINTIETIRSSEGDCDENSKDSVFCQPTKFYLWENNEFKKISIDQEQLIK